MKVDSPRGWIDVALGDVVASPRPKAAPSDHPNLPYVGMDHIASNGMELLGSSKFGEMKSNGGLFFDGDVLYGRIRPYLNKVHRARFKGACSAEFIVLPKSEVIDSDFLAYLLHHKKFVNYASSKSSGDRPRIDFGAVANYEFTLPPKKEQERISSKIDELFSRISEGERALEQVQELVERYRQSVLKAAVIGELTREWREKNKDQLESGEVLLARILKARREAWEQAELEKMRAKGVKPKNDDWKKKYKEPVAPDTSDLPELPEGWVWASLDSLAVVVGGITVDKKRSIEDCKSVPYLRVANVQRGYLDLSEVKSILAPQDRIDQLRLVAGDILFNEGGDIDKLGRGWIWEGQLPDCIHQNHVFRARLFAQGPWNKIISWYGNVLGRKLFTRMGKQTTNLASLSLSKLKAFPVPLMSELEATEVVSCVEDVLSISDKQLKEVTGQTSASQALRQSVLRSAFSGELVPQDPSDEPASVLLERIAAAREKAVTTRSKRQPRKKAAAKAKAVGGRK